METIPNETLKLLAEGQAGLMIAESLLLILVEAKVIEKEKLVDAIETIIATKRAMMIDGTGPEVSAAAVGLLSNIANSLTAVNASPEPPPSSAEPSRARRS